MADIEVRFDVSAPIAIGDARDSIEALRGLGFDVLGPLEPIEKRFDPVTAGVVVAEVVMIIRLSRMAIEDLDRIVDVVRKWVNIVRGNEAPSRRVEIYDPDNEVVREIEPDE